MEFIKFPSINQYRNVIRDVVHVYDGSFPVLKFTGTVKVHGTNASVVIMPDGSQYAQSRNNVITPEQDNAGFAAWHSEKIDCFSDIWGKVARPSDSSVVVYGEWAGKGVQKGVAVSEVDKFFYVFGVAISWKDSVIWLTDYPKLTDMDNRVIDSRYVASFVQEIDFSNPGLVQNHLAELTEGVENKCPVGEMFGVDGIGEGIVWSHITDNGKLLSFKVKGEKHSVTKVKKLASVDTEKLKSIDDFVAYAVTENRLEQGFSYVCNEDPDRKLLGGFLKWVNSDVYKEESDTMVENGLTMKDVGGAISKKAKNWFFDKEANL